MSQCHGRVVVCEDHQRVLSRCKCPGIPSRVRKAACPGTCMTRTQELCAGFGSDGDRVTFWWEYQLPFDSVDET